MPNPFISIIIPTRNAENAKECVASIAKNTKVPYEVVIVSRDGGCAEKINEGIEKCKGDYVVILHDDCEVTEGWDEEVSDVGAFRVSERDGTLQIYGGFFTGCERYCHCHENIPPEYSFFLCLSKSALEKIGKFDEAYHNPWCLDVDMGMQIKKAGFIIRPLKGHVIHHSRNLTTDNVNRSYLIKKWFQ